MCWSARTIAARSIAAWPVDCRDGDRLAVDPGVDLPVPRIARAGPALRDRDGGCRPARPAPAAGASRAPCSRGSSTRGGAECAPRARRRAGRSRCPCRSARPGAAAGPPTRGTGRPGAGARAARRCRARRHASGASPSGLHAAPCCHVRERTLGRVTARWRRIWVSWERSSTTWARRKTWRQRSTRSRSPTPSSVGSSAGRPPRRGHDRDHHRKKPDPEERIPVGGVRVRVQRARGTARLRDAARAAVPIPQRGTRPRNRRMLSRSQSARAPRRRANAAPRAPSTRCR